MTIQAQKHSAPLIEVPDNEEWGGDFIVLLSMSEVDKININTQTIYTKHLEWLNEELLIEKAKYPESGLYVDFDGTHSYYQGKFSNALLQKIRQREEVRMVSKKSKQFKVFIKCKED